jgi:hypothetical protein
MDLSAAATTKTPQGRLRVGGSPRIYAGELGFEAERLT